MFDGFLQTRAIILVSITIVNSFPMMKIDIIW